MAEVIEGPGEEGEREAMEDSSARSCLGGWGGGGWGWGG
jgi:hypothetical protein